MFVQVFVEFIDFAFVYSNDRIVNSLSGYGVAREGVFHCKVRGPVPQYLYDYFSHSNGKRGARSCFVLLLVVFTVVLKVG